MLLSLMSTVKKKSLLKYSGHGILGARMMNWDGMDVCRKDGARGLTKTQDVSKSWLYEFIQ